METVNFAKNTLSRRMKSMLSVDFRRMFRSRLFYIMLAVCLFTPVLILVMTTMMDGSVSVNPQTGEETIVEGFDNVWQIIGSLSGGEVSTEDGMSMDMMSMCNMNLIYFAVAVLVCLFVADDFRSGFVKNLFTVRAKKTEYVFSKTAVLTLSSALLIIAFLIGAMLGGAVSGLPFAMEGFDTANLVMCLLSKLLLTLVFVPICLCISVGAKQKTWASLLGACAACALLFMMIPALTPLNATIMNVILCTVGGALFSVSLGAVSNIILKKTSLV